MSPATEGTWRALFSGATRATAIIIAVAIALHSANIYVAGAVMPSIAADIGGLQLYAWSTTAFVFAAVLGSTATATLLAHWGTRTTYRAAALSVVAGTVVCALAPAMPVLIAGRFVQGLAGGLLFALAYSLVRLALPERLWSLAMGLVSAMWGVGTFAGPALGGTLAELDQWRLAFWVIVAVTAFFAVWGAAHLPRDAGRSATRAPVPVASVGLLGAAVLTLSVASISTRVEVNVAGVGVAALLLFGWLRHERRTEHGLLPSATFVSGGRLGSIYMMMALLMIAATPEVFISYFAQELQGLGPLGAGYLGTAIAAGWTSASLLRGGAERREGGLEDYLALAVSAAGLLLLVGVGPLRDGGVATVGGVALGFVLLGWGIGMAWPRLTTAVLSSVPAAEQERAGASITTVQLTAAAAGAAIGGAIVNLAGFTDGAAGGTEHAARWLYIAMLAAPLLAAACAWLQPGRRQSRRAEALATAAR